MTDSESERPATVAHLAGQTVTYGTLTRQMCKWCGSRLINEDSTLVAYQIVEGEEDKPHVVPTWPIDQWVEVTGVNPTMYSTVEHEGDIAPENSCMRLPEMYVAELVRRSR